MKSNNKKSTKSNLKRFENIKSALKKLIPKRKALILPITLIVLSLSAIPIGIMLSIGTQTISDNNTIKEQFSEILLETKENLEEDFQDILDEMEDDPLDGLYMDKMPTPEEIFFTEWSNDWFPEVQIPLIGDYIESIGAKMVGNISLDSEPPEADLNISSHLSPSGISLLQCNKLWDTIEEYSLVSTDPSIWFRISEGSNEERIVLKLEFNLTDNQIDLICNWIIFSQNTWMGQFAEKEIMTVNPFIIGGFLGVAGALITLSVFILRSELRKGRKTRTKNLDLKNHGVDIENENK